METCRQNISVNTIQYGNIPKNISANTIQYGNSYKIVIRNYKTLCYTVVTQQCGAVVYIPATIY